jgi:high-affinity K+ transport system ATPase subunit B
VSDVVVGDIIIIETGMRIPADCIMLEGMDVTVNESPYFEDREAIAPKFISEGNVQYNNH